MKYTLIFLVLLISFLSFCNSCNEIPEVYAEGWYRGNTHTHARLSDDHDQDDVPRIAGWYRKAGYSFLLLSEHNDHLEKKKIICHDELTEEGKFLMLCGLELSNKKHHTALGIDQYIGNEESLQDGVEKTIAAGGLPILNHPVSSKISMKTFIGTAGLNHLEVFNGNRPEQTPYAEMLWDSILSAPDGRIVYAVAADDNHYKASNAGRGWIMVKAPALTKQDIQNSIRYGNFYASTGVILNNITIDAGSLYVDSQNGSRITFIGQNGTILDSFDDLKATYTFKGDELYVRAKVTDSNGKAAWTQPVFPGRL